MAEPTAEEVETVARSICQSQGVSPDDLVYAGPPITVLVGLGAYGYYKPSGEARPAWTVFAQVAKAALLTASNRRG